MNSKTISFIAVICCTFTIITAQSTSLSKNCIGCICEAVSGCNLAAPCDGDICGPFKLTLPFWIDGGKPTLNHEDHNDPGAFKRCASDAFCAARALEGYVSKYAQDCNGDGVVDCTDFALIHQYGGYGCSNRVLNAAFDQVFGTCRASYPN